MKKIYPNGKRRLSALALQETGSEKPSGLKIVSAMIEVGIKQREQSQARWKLIEELLTIEGYEVIPGLWEHEIKKVQK